MCQSVKVCTIAFKATVHKIWLNRYVLSLWPFCRQHKSLQTTAYKIFFFCIPKLYLWGSPFWVRFLCMWPLFNPTIKVVTFRLRGCRRSEDISFYRLEVCDSSAFNRLIHFDSSSLSVQIRDLTMCNRDTGSKSTRLSWEKQRHAIHIYTCFVQILGYLVCNSDTRFNPLVCLCKSVTVLWETETRDSNPQVCLSKSVAALCAIQTKDLNPLVFLSKSVAVLYAIEIQDLIPQILSLKARQHCVQYRYKI